MKTIEIIVGLNIRQRRKALGLTQTQLAEKVGLTLQSINRIEKGARPSRPTNLDAIARALGCTPTDLTIDNENMPKPSITIQELTKIIDRLGQENAKLLKDMASFDLLRDEYEALKDKVAEFTFAGGLKIMNVFAKQDSEFHKDTAKVVELLSLLDRKYRKTMLKIISDTVERLGAKIDQKIFLKIMRS